MTSTNLGAGRNRPKKSSAQTPVRHSEIALSAFTYLPWACLVALRLLAPAFCSVFLLALPAHALNADDELNLLCLKASYPEISHLETGPAGDQWLVLRDGRKLAYAIQGQSAIREAMAQIYPLDPARDDPPPGFAPGRERPYELFAALYGADATQVKRQLARAPWFGKHFNVSERLKEPLARVAEDLKRYQNPEFSRLLAPDGGFVWRKIAGETRQSAHSYGIAVDIGSRHAPYWRWSKNMPHPMQKSYPGEIVRAFEKQGFIWGGKWREYDLMHFEYRPELICKAQYSARPPSGR